MKALFAILLLFTGFSYADQLSDQEFQALSECMNGLSYNLTDQQQTKDFRRGFSNVTYVRSTQMGANTVSANAFVFADLEASPVPALYVFQNGTQTRSSIPSENLRGIPDVQPREGVSNGRPRSQCPMNNPASIYVPIDASSTEFCFPAGCSNYYVRVGFGQHTYYSQTQVSEGVSQLNVLGTEQFMCRHGRDQSLEITNSTSGSRPVGAFQMNEVSNETAVRRMIQHQLSFIASHIGPGTSVNLSSSFESVLSAGGACNRIVPMVGGSPDSWVNAINCLRGTETRNCALADAFLRQNGVNATVSR